MEDNYRILLESLDEVAFLVDGRGDLVYISPAVERISGYRVDEMLEKNFTFFTHPDDIPYMLKGLAEQLAGNPQPHEFRALDKDGSVRYVHTSGRMISRNGEPVIIAGSLIDVTERRHTLEALRDSEKKFRTVLQLSNDAVILFDVRGEISFWSSGAERLFGYNEGEMLGQSIATIVPPEFHRRHQDILKELSCAEQRGMPGAPAREMVVIRKDGSVFRCEFSLATWKSSDQALFSAIIHDVSERREAEEALRRGEEYYRSLIEHSQDIILVLNQDGTLRYVSPSFERVFGYRTDEMTGLDAFSFAHPEDVPELIRGFAEGIGQPGKTVMSEFRIRHADGHWVHVEAIGSNLLHDPAVAGIVINSRDITARREAEEALRLRELYFRCLIENGLDIISILDVDGTILYESPSYQRLQGFTPDEMVGKCVFDFIHPEDVSGILPIFLGAVGLPGSIHTCEYRLLHRDGYFNYLESIGMNLLDDPVVKGIVINSRDITERKKYEDTLEMNAHQLRDFLSIASHELHHPIAIIKGYAQTLAEETSPEENPRRWQMLDALEKAADRLNRLGDNLLDVSRLEQDRVSMIFTIIEPADLLRQCAVEMEARSFFNPFEVRVTGDPARVKADSDELLRVLNILVENAVGFSPPESTIELELAGDGEKVIFSVLDRGIGVPEDQREKVFECFHQVEHVMHHSRPGLGLGLFIAREIVEEHGGNIWCEGRAGGGSAFHFTLPGQREKTG